MKALITTIIAICLFTLACSAQWTTSGTNIYNSNTGNVGIGTTAPAVKLDVNGAARLGGNLTFLADQTAYFITGPANGGAVRIRSNANLNIDRNVQLGVIDNTGAFGSILTAASNGYVGIGTTAPGNSLSFPDITTNSTNGITWYSPAPLSYGIYRTAGTWAAPNYQQLAVYFDTGILLNPGSAYGKSYVEIAGGGLRVTTGNVGIGTTNPDQKLTVNGTIHSKSVIVDLSVVPDYVLKPTYKLPTLAYLKNYIDKNSHLPEVPSEAEIKKNGLDVGEMNAVLLKKVEELTLYMIEKDKQIKQLQTQVKKLQKRKK